MPSVYVYMCVCCDGYILYIYVCGCVGVCKGIVGVERLEDAVFYFVCVCVCIHKMNKENYKCTYMCVCVCVCVCCG
jgi:hypothetical protein